VKGWSTFLRGRRFGSNMDGRLKGVLAEEMGYSTYLRHGNIFGPNGFSSGSSTRVYRI